ncbi:CPBP family intramembrane glutamic endopeptidase [Aureibaculum algae]|uniref:CPBP family intramembrane glutamic endopeptidase n=1 Tax=Aureibaculum algae TaxID=2584122 RepID=UPI001586635C|nr:CPBP family intramembrane glutamic endopeptidase [Aureibaculum algae]
MIQPITVPINFIENLNKGLFITTSFKSSYNFLSIDFFYYLAIIVVANPILEELFFRKIMITEINNKFGAFGAVLVSSLLFSVVHLEVNQMQSAFVVGVVLGYIYLKTNNVTITILLHMLFNFGVYITKDSLVTLSSQYYYLLLYPVLAIVLYYLIKQIVKANPSER